MASHRARDARTHLPLSGGEQIAKVNVAFACDVPAAEACETAVVAKAEVIEVYRAAES